MPPEAVMVVGFVTVAVVVMIWVVGEAEMAGEEGEEEVGEGVITETADATPVLRAFVSTCG